MSSPKASVGDLNKQAMSLSAKKGIILGVIVLHAAMFYFLRHFEGVPAATYLTLGLSTVVMSVYYSGAFGFSTKIWTGIFALLLVIEPVYVLHAYALNAKEFATVLPSMHVTPVFAWVRPAKAAMSHSRIYQFVPYEDFWYDMSMTDAPAKVGFPQSTTRWTFDLSEHTPANELANYAQYKIILYDYKGGAGEPQWGPSPALKVNYFDVNTLKMNTDFVKPRVLVYNDSYTSSWKALVDGLPVELLRVNGAFKGINVPAGKHLIEFSYHPPGGRWVYVAASVALLVFFILTMLCCGEG